MENQLIRNDYNMLRDEIASLLPEGRFLNRALLETGLAEWF